MTRGVIVLEFEIDGPVARVESDLVAIIRHSPHLRPERLRTFKGAQVATGHDAFVTVDRIDRRAAT